MQSLTAPRLLEFSQDGSRLWYKLGAQWWEVSTAPNSRPKHTNHTPPPQDAAARSKGKNSPDGKRVAYLKQEHPAGASLLMLATSEPGAAAKAVSRMPV